MGVGLAAFGLPGPLLILAAAAGFGWLEGFQRLDTKALAALAGLALAAEGAEFLAAALGAKRAKAAPRTILAALAGAMIGALVGSGVLPVIGTMLGAMAGAFLAAYGMEFALTGDAGQARKVARRAALGQVLGMLAKFACAMAMAAIVVGRLLWPG